jgi:RNA-directed DNA polymerase
LYDRIWRADILREAWKRVQRNGGSAGIDEESIAAIRALGEDAFVADLGERLRAGRYRPQAVRRCWIPKANGGRRPLGIPTVRDRVVQAATKLVLEPIFEVDFQDCSYGFRPGRNATQALEVLRVRGARGGNHVLDADIADFFGSLDREVLMKRLMRRISDRRVLRLIRMWLDAGVIEEGREIAMLSGVPQGGVISPLLSNIYLAFLDERWTKQCADLGTLVRYADDFVIMCDTRAKVDEAERRVKIIFQRLKLKLHPEKTRKVEIAGGKAGFDFLGCHLRKRMSGPIWAAEKKRRYFLQRWPSTKSMKRVRQRVKELTPRAAQHRDLRETIAKLNPVLRGWGGYFRTGNAARKFNQIDGYVWQRLRSLVRKRKGRNLRPGEMARWTRDEFVRLGLHRCVATSASCITSSRRPPPTRSRRRRCSTSARSAARPSRRWPIKRRLTRRSPGSPRSPRRSSPTSRLGARRGPARPRRPRAGRAGRRGRRATRGDGSRDELSIHERRGGAGRVYQKAQARNPSWSGRRAHRAQVGTSRPPSGRSFTAMLMLAGNTASKSATRPQAAHRRVAGRMSPRPPAISATPEA